MSNWSVKVCDAWILLLLFFIPLRARASADHLYSSLAEENCRVIQRSADGSVAEEACPGVLGYGVIKRTKDSRDSVAVVHDGVEQVLPFSGILTDHLNHLGNQVEWQLRDGDLVGIIFKLYLTLPRKEKEVQRYVVAKLQPSEFCVVHLLEARGKEAAQEAEADAAQALETECLWK